MKRDQQQKLKLNLIKPIADDNGDTATTATNDACFFFPQLISPQGHTYRAIFAKDIIIIIISLYHD